MKTPLKIAFSILDGRLSSSIDDVYQMLNYIFTQNFYTHQLPTAMNLLKEKNPKWFVEGVALLDQIKRENNTNDFSGLMKIIDEHYSSTYIILEKIEDEHIPFLAGLDKFNK